MIVQNFRYVLGLACLLTTSAFADINLHLTDMTGDPTSVSIAPGASFTFDVRLASDQPFTSLSFFLESDTPDLFKITARTSSPANPLADATTPDSTVTNASNAMLDPINGADLGFTADDFSTNIAAGDYPIAAFTIAADPLTPFGTYTFSVPAGAAISDAEFSEYAVAGGTYTINVVPEPTTLAFVAMTAGALLRRRR